jgi:hypothetical protein
MDRGSWKWGAWKRQLRRRRTNRQYLINRIMMSWCTWYVRTVRMRARTRRFRRTNR